MRSNVAPSQEASSGTSRYSIGQIAGRFGLAVHVLRHWEAVGLLRPARDAGGRRRYDEHDLLRVALIQQGEELHFSLDQVHTVLTSDEPAERRTELRRQHAELTRRIQDAEHARRIIAHALDCPGEDFLACPRMRRALLDRIPTPVTETVTVTAET